MKKFERLLEAIRSGDQEALEHLRHDWEEIRTYVEQNKPGKVDLPADKRLALILWLSTPPTPQPTNWNAVTDVPSFVLDTRDEQIAVVEQLWGAWTDKTILEQLEVNLKGFEHAPQWLQHASEWFQTMTTHEEIKDQQTRLDVVSGYGAFVNQILVEQRCPLTEARAEVLGFERPPALALPAGERIPVTDLAEAITFRSGIKQEQSMPLAYAISLSVPAHRDVLPTVDVGINSTNCWLTPNSTLPVIP